MSEVAAAAISMCGDPAACHAGVGVASLPLVKWGSTGTPLTLIAAAWFRRSAVVTGADSGGFNWTIVSGAPISPQPQGWRPL